MVTSQSVPVSLPPAEVPLLATPALAPVQLRRMQLVDNPTAFALSEIAFIADGATTAAEHSARQARWVQQGRAWYGWLHAQAQGNAWVATCGADGPIIGYARALRDPARQMEQLTELYVHPAFQRGKVGKALLSAVLAERVPLDWQRIIVAHPSPPALALYYRWGTLPLGAAWYMLARPHRSGQSRGIERGQPGGVERGQPQGIAPTDTLTVDLGPILGATPSDALALVQAQIAAAWAAGATQIGLWVPTANTTLLCWLRDASGLRLELCSQVMIMGS